MASGGQWRASDQTVPQQEIVVSSGDSASSSAVSGLTDDTVPTSLSTQSTQPNGGFSKGNRLVVGATITTSCYKVIIPSQYNYWVLKEGFITSCCGQTYCFRCRRRVHTMCPLCHEPVPTRSTNPVVSGATCWLNQKERNLIPCLLFLPCNEAMLPYIEAEQLVPARPPPINHPYILPFPHDSTIDYSYYQQLQLFTFDENSQDVSFYYDQDGHGRGKRESRWPECQMCWNGRVECVFMPCRHARTCQSCSNRFIRQPCPFCRAVVDYILRVYF